MDETTVNPTSHLFIEALGASDALLAAWHLPIACAPVADVVVLKVPDPKGTAVDHCEGVVQMRDLVCRNVRRQELVGLRPPLEPIPDNKKLEEAFYTRRVASIERFQSQDDLTEVRKIGDKDLATGTTTARCGGGLSE